MKIKLSIFRADGSTYWTEYFNSHEACTSWLEEEKSRPYWHPEFTYTVEEINDAPQALPEVDARKAYAIEAQAFGADVLAEIHAINDAKMSANAMSGAEFAELMQSPELALIERLLWAGAIGTAKTMIDATVIPFYSNAEKAAIVSKLTDFLLNHGRS